MMATLDYDRAFQFANQLFHNGKVGEAIQAYVEIAQSARGLSNMPILARALHQAGLSCGEKVIDSKGSSFRDAIAFYKEASVIYKSLNDTVGLAALYRDLAVTCVQGKDWRGAVKYFSNSINLLNKINNPAELAFTYAHFGLYYYRRADYQSALDKIETAQELIRQDPSQGYYAAVILLNKAKVLYKIFDYEKARDAAVESLGWFEADHGDQQYYYRKAQLYGLLFLIEGQLAKDSLAQSYHQKFQKLVSGLDPELALVIEKDWEFLNNGSANLK